MAQKICTLDKCTCIGTSSRSDNLREAHIAARKGIISFESYLSLNGNTTLGNVDGRTTHIYLIEWLQNEAIAIDLQVIIKLNGEGIEQRLADSHTLGLLDTARHGDIGRRCRLQQTTSRHNQILDGHILGEGVCIGARNRSKDCNGIILLHIRHRRDVEQIVCAKRNILNAACHQTLEVDRESLHRPILLLAIEHRTSHKGIIAQAIGTLDKLLNGAGFIVNSIITLAIDSALHLDAILVAVDATSNRHYVAILQCKGLEIIAVDGKRTILATLTARHAHQTLICIISKTSRKAKQIGNGLARAHLVEHRTLNLARHLNQLAIG